MRGAPPCRQPRAALAFRPQCVWRSGAMVLAHWLSRRTVAVMPDSGPTVRLAAPSLRGVVRLVAIVAACAVALYLVWRTRGVLRVPAIAAFLVPAVQPRLR